MHISAGLLNVVTVAFIVTTMLAAGMASRLSAIARLARDLPLVALAAVANLVLIPMLGWGLGAAFGLGAARSGRASRFCSAATWRPERRSSSRSPSLEASPSHRPPACYSGWPTPASR